MVKVHNWFFLCSVFQSRCVPDYWSSKLSNIQLVQSFSKGEAGSGEALFRTIVDTASGWTRVESFVGERKKKEPMSNTLGT